MHYVVEHIYSIFKNMILQTVYARQIKPFKTYTRDDHVTLVIYETNYV